MTHCFNSDTPAASPTPAGWNPRMPAPEILRARQAGQQDAPPPDSPVTYSIIRDGQNMRLSFTQNGIVIHDPRGTFHDYDLFDTAELVAERTVAGIRHKKFLRLSVKLQCQHDLREHASDGRPYIERKSEIAPFAGPGPSPEIAQARAREAAERAAAAAAK